MLDREKREFFKLMYQRILSDLDFFIKDFLNFSSQDNAMDNINPLDTEYIAFDSEVIFVRIVYLRSEIVLRMAVNVVRFHLK